MARTAGPAVYRVGLWVLFLLLTSVGSPGAAANRVVYFYNWYGSDPQEPVFQRAIAEFREAYPDIELELVRGGSVSGQSPTDRLIAMIAAGNPPDVLSFERSIIIEFAAKGILRPLDRDLGSLADEFVPGALQEVIYRGETYGVPWGTDIRGLFWNKADFAESGLDAELAPATMEELDAMAARLTRADGDGKFTKVGFVPWLGNWYGVGWLYTFGGEIFDAESVRPRVNTPNHVRAMEWIQEYGQRFPYDVVAAAISGKSGNTFYDRTVSMLPNWNGYANLIQMADPTIEFWAGAMPHPPYGQNGTWMGGYSHVMLSAARNPEGGVTLLKWVSRPEVEVDLFRSTGSLPTRWSALAEIGDELSPTDAILVQQIDVAWGRPPLWFPPFLNSIQDAMTRVARLETSPQDALDEAQRKLEIDFAEILGVE